MNYILTILLTAITALGFNYFNPPKIWDSVVQLGSINFPTSLDSLTNPSGTDSVATVSHSSQHSNANDAIEALEAKAGTGASTPVANSIFSGNGAGSSIWTTYPTSTNFTINSLGTFGSFISLASSTIIGNLNITGNSTTTNATSTYSFATTASSTNLYGASLSNCATNNALTWTDGKFGCESTATSVSSVSTTTTYGTFYGTTTVTGISPNKILNVSIFIGTTTMGMVGDQTAVNLVFNENWIADIKGSRSVNGGAAGAFTEKVVYLPGTTNNTYTSYITLTIDNLTGHTRVGNYQYQSSYADIATGFIDTGAIAIGSFTWATTTPITSISVNLTNNSQPNITMSSTTINVIQN